MTTLHFSIQINASKEKVWEVLWNDSSYRQWTSAFSEGSYVVTDWKEGSKVQFLSSNGDGMYSTIAKSVPAELMSFKHLGVMKNGKEEATDEETKKWSGAMENYMLKENAGVTTLAVDIDVTEEFTDYFKKTFPNALEKVKSLSEN
jgi:hypothetical protein